MTYLKNIHNILDNITIVCPPLPFLLGGGVELPTKFSKRGTWQDLSFERGVAGKEEVTFFRGGGVGWGGVGGGASHKGGTIFLWGES